MSNVPAFFPTAANSVGNRSYILSITPHASGSANHLILSHPSPDLSVIDASTLQTLDFFRGGHAGDITSVATSTSSAPAYQVNGGAGLGEQGNGMSALGSVWSAGKDARVVRWDERSRSAGQTIKGESNAVRAIMELTSDAAAVRGPVPLVSLAIHERENLVVAGTELTSYESHILYWYVNLSF